MNTHNPEWIITTSSNPIPHKVCFKDLFALRANIRSIMLLFDYNSYYINLDERYFIVNGGRRIQPTGFVMMLNPTALSVCRHTRTMNVGGEGEPTETVTYLLGAEGDLNGEMRQILIQIIGDGRFWVWRDKR